MPRPFPIVSSRQVISALAKIGFRIIPGRGKGSHTFMRRDDPAMGITIPDVKEIKRGILRGIIRQSGLTVDQFVDLLDQ